MPQYIHTPLIYSSSLSEIISKQVFLKLELLQPSGSFKDRGIGNLCMHFAQTNDKGFIASSGGNAGISVAFAGKKLKRPATIIVPKTTSQMMIQKIRHLNAQVIVHGDNWNEADEFAHRKVEQEQLNYIPPFDHPLIWQGYESLVDELVSDHYRPDSIILSVGGGGLFTGIVQGLAKHGWNDIPIITAEPEGAATLAKAVEKKEHITLSEIKTIAGTLGAKKIAEEAYRWCHKWKIFPQILSDRQAVNACLQFAYDHRLLVEPACGIALSVIYNNLPVLKPYKNICVIVDGGNGVSLDLLQKWRADFNL